MMKNKLSLLKVALLAIIISFVSCSKEDETPGLFGTWEAEGSYDYEGYELDYKQTLTLTENSYDILGTASHPFLGSHDIAGLRGPLTVEGDSLFFTISEAGYAKIEGSGLSVSVGPLIYYENGDPEFEEAMALINETVPLRAMYEIRGGKLFLTGDVNEDSDVNDEFEMTEFSAK